MDSKIKSNLYTFLSLLGFLGLIVFNSGCSSMGRSVGLGGAIGAGSGAVLGGIVDPGKNGKFRTRNVVIGAAIGGLAGSIAGGAVHENTEREKEIAYLKGRDSKKQKQNSGGIPSIQDPKVEAQWIESRVVGNRYVEGHFEYVITEPTRWEAP